MDPETQGAVVPEIQSGENSHGTDDSDEIYEDLQESGILPEEGQQIVGKREDMWVLRLRVITASFLVFVAIITCALVYLTGRQSETKAYQKEFSDLGQKLVQSFEDAVKQRFEVLTAFSESLTVEASQSFPFYVPSDFSERAERVAKLAEVMALHLIPIVTRDQLEEWNTYSVENSYWRPEGMARERAISLDEVNASAYEPYLYNPYVRPGENVPTEEINPTGPYMPIWLSYPVSDYPLANLDLFSDWEHTVPLNKTFWTGKPVLEFSYDYLGHMERDIRWDFITGNKFVDYQDDPHGTAVIPGKLGRYSFLAFSHGVILEVFDKFGDDKKVAATFLIYIYWRTYFDNLLPPGADGVIVVLENTCNQTYTYRVDGANSFWLGRGDRHDAKYDFLEFVTSINGILGPEGDDGIGRDDFGEDTESDILYYDCFYNIRIYPSEHFEARYRSNAPINQALTLAGLFLFTFAILVAYDYMVERRQKLVLKSAMQSGKLVSSLFPEEVRKRLYEEQKQEETQQKRSIWEKYVMNPVVEEPNGTDRTAIATLYPETTIFFADICGFTAWSSKRTPAEVFMLLETIYGFFDSVARKRKVFKVETVRLILFHVFAGF